MKRLLYLIFPFSCLTSYAEKQDSIGVETKGDIKYVRYLVSPGETVYQLSTTHKVSITELMTDNPGLENGLKVGQIVLLRNYIRKEQIKTSQFETKAESHVVQKGETYYGLSQKYGIPMNDLLKWNGVELKEGQVLVLKETKPEITTETKPVIPVTPKPIVTETKPATSPVTSRKPVVTEPKPATNNSNPTLMGADNTNNAPVKPVATPKPTETPKPVETKPTVTPPATAATPTKVVNPPSPKVEEIINPEEIYEFDPNKQQVLVIPFDPHLYWSDADDEIMKGSGLTSKLEVRKTIRRRLNALLDPMGFEVIHLLGGKFQDTLTDLNKIYSSVSYDYQSAILSEEYKKTLAAQEVANKENGEVATQTSFKNKLNSVKDKYIQPTTVEDAKIDKNADKYFGVVLKDPKFFEYFNHKYSVDYYIFVNQFEVITDYDHCLDRTTENYVRYFVVHFSIFDKNGTQIAGNQYKQLNNSNSNNIDRITGDNLQKMADRILLELPVPNK